jgi:hypothetical protein
MKIKNLVAIVPKLIAASLLFGTFTRHSYDYYTLLRWLVCGVSAFAAVRAGRLNKSSWTWAFAIIALFYNPIIPVHLKRDSWAWIDPSVAIFLLVSIWFIDRRH